MKLNYSIGLILLLAFTVQAASISLVPNIEEVAVTYQPSRLVQWISWFLSFLGFEPSFGASITTINATDKITDSRTVINNNFASLNNAFSSTGALTVLTVTATSTTASSTFSGGINSIRPIAIGQTATTTIQGNNATSTFAGGISVLTAGGLTSANGVTITGGSFLNTGSATSTWGSAGLSVAGGGLASSQGLVISGGESIFANDARFDGGLTITCTGCVTDANVVDTITLTNITQVTNRAFTDITGGTAGSIIFSNGTALTQNNANLFWDNTNLRLGIGTTSPSDFLSIQGGVLISRNLSVAGITATSTISTTGTATSTWAGGINMTGGCFATNGVCVGGGGGGSVLLSAPENVQAAVSGSTTIFAVNVIAGALVAGESIKVIAHSTSTLTAGVSNSIENSLHLGLGTGGATTSCGVRLNRPGNAATVGYYATTTIEFTIRAISSTKQTLSCHIGGEIKNQGSDSFFIFSQSAANELDVPNNLNAVTGATDSSLAQTLMLEALDGPTNSTRSFSIYGVTAELLNL